MENIVGRAFSVNAKVSPEIFQEIILNSEVEIHNGYLTREYRLTLTWLKSTSTRRNSFSPMRIIVSPNEIEIIGHIQDFLNRFNEESKKNGNLSPDDAITFLIELGFENKADK